MGGTRSNHWLLPGRVQGRAGAGRGTWAKPFLSWLLGPLESCKSGRSSETQFPPL